MNPRIAPHLLRQLRAVHDGLARNLEPAFSSMLRAPCAARVCDFGTIAYGRFVASVETPACFYMARRQSDAQKGAGADDRTDRMILDIEPALLHSMIDRLLGGCGGDPPPGRPMTEIERSVADRVVRRFIDECRAVWHRALDVSSDGLRVESTPAMLGVYPDDEMMLVVDFEVGVGEISGFMRLCLPARLVHSVAGSLSANGARHATPSNDGAVEIGVTLVKTSMTGRELNDLQLGDIITTETPMESPAVVSIAGVQKFHGKPGMYQGRKAVVILGDLAGGRTVEPS